MGIVHNGVTIGRVFYNGVELDAVYQNGVKVFEKVVAPTWVTTSSDTFMVQDGSPQRGWNVPQLTNPQIRNTNSLTRRVYIYSYTIRTPTLITVSVNAWYTFSPGETKVFASSGVCQYFTLGTIQELR